MFSISKHSQSSDSRTSPWSFDNFLTINTKNIIHACRKPRCIIIIHKSNTYVMLIRDEHTSCTIFKRFYNNIRECDDIMIESRVIGKNHSLVEDILHFEIDNFLKVFCPRLCKTSSCNKLKQFWLSFPKSRLLRNDIQSTINHRLDVLNFSLIAMKFWNDARITTDGRRIPETITIRF